MTRFLQVACTVAAIWLAAPPTLAEDPAQPDSIWEGSLKVSNRIDGKLRINTHDCRLVILERDGTKLSGEFW